MVINSGYSWDHFLMHLVRCILFFSAAFDFNPTAAHIPGRYNTLADPISRTIHIFFPFILPTGYLPASHSASQHNQCATNRKTGLDVKQLDTLVSFYFRASLAPSTTHSYELAKRKYLQFCLKSNVSPIPVTEGKLCSFVSI